MQQAQRQVGAHARQHLVKLEGLGDVIHPAHGEGVDLVGGGIQRADEDDRDVARLRLGFELLAHLVAGHLGHQDIQQDQVWRAGVDRLQGAPAVIGNADVIAAVFQYLG